MSYDVYLLAQTGGEPVEAYWRNHTSNTARMWREAGCDLAEFEGKPAAELLASLDLAIARMADDPDHYRQWDAPNGWGDYDSTLRFLTAVRDACRDFPETIVHVSR